MAEHQDRTAYLGIALWPLAYFMAAMMMATFAALAALVVVRLAAIPRKST
jgi:hypothetical protein